MATKLKDVDVVLVGVGLVGGILAKELSEAGLSVVGLERGMKLETNPHFAVPQIRDELRFAQRTEMMMNTARETITFRHRPGEVALPMRRLGAFMPGEAVGGSGLHWNGYHWRWLPDKDLRIRSFYEQRYGKAFIPRDMPLQDWGVTYGELERHYDRFEYTFAISGKAGNIKGEIQPDGNPFEPPHQRDYPLPPLKDSLATSMFGAAATNLGYHPFMSPAANASQAYTNPDGAKFGACQYCGHCERFGCEANAKGSPHLTVLPIALKNPNFELRTRTWVTTINLDSSRRRASSVSYTDVTTGEEYEQPAGIVILCAFATNNTHLMLLSRIGAPYDPATGKGVVGRNYCYQVNAGVTLFFEDRTFNPFMAAGALARRMDDFHANEAFDHAPLGFLGGATIGTSSTGGRPIGYHPVPPGAPRWGSAWKRATAKWYQRSMSISTSSSNMPNRYNCCDLDPTYRNAVGQPLMRLTYNFTDNDFKTRDFMVQKAYEIARSLNPAYVTPPDLRHEDFSIVPYQSTHNTGGVIMGADPASSVVNNYLQSWDVPNLFVVGASAFPHNSAYNPTGPLGALTYRTAEAITKRYVKRPGPLA